MLLLTKLLHRITFCACFAANTWNGQNFPFLSQDLFYENGTIYDQLAILDSNFRVDPAKLAEAVCYFFFFFFFVIYLDSLLTIHEGIAMVS